MAYKIESTQREEVSAFPEVALREAVINAVCHRVYFDKRANVVIEVFENRIEISNPGGLPSGLSPADFGSKSVARNPVIAAMLHRIDYIGFQFKTDYLVGLISRRRIRRYRKFVTLLRLPDAPAAYLAYIILRASWL